MEISQMKISQNNIVLALGGGMPTLGSAVPLLEVIQVDRLNVGLQLGLLVGAK